MISTILSYILILVLLYVFYVFIKLYLSMRKTSNVFIAAASDQFFKKCDSLLTAKETELPDNILDFINFMNKTANSRYGHWELYKALRKNQRVRIKRTVSSNKVKEFNSSIQGLREELKELFSEAVTGWINYLIHRNVLTGFLILLEFRKLQAQSGAIEVEEDDFRADFVTRLGKRSWC